MKSSILKYKIIKNKIKSNKIIFEIFDNLENNKPIEFKWPICINEQEQLKNMKEFYKNTDFKILNRYICTLCSGFNLYMAT